MLLCETTLRELVFDDFLWMYVASEEAHEAIEDWLWENPVPDSRGIPWAYLHRSEIDGLDGVEVPG